MCIRDRFYHEDFEEYPGAWFSCPVDFEEIRERLGVQSEEEIVVEEIEDRENTNLTITKTINRLGTVFFLFIFNIGISIFVFLLTGIMIFSQVLFIIYAMFLPVRCV